MTKTRRVAVAIGLSFPFRHHHDVFAGIPAMPASTPTGLRRPALHPHA